MRRATLSLAALVALSAAPRAEAQSEKEACVAAHADAQKLRTDAKLAEARERLLACARPECPAAVRSDCAKWLSEVQDEIPSLIVVATDANGSDVADVKVLVDGQVLASELNGQPLMLNPGPHKLRFEREGSAPVERDVVVRVSERNRRIEVQFSPELAGGPGPATAPVSSSADVSADTSSGGRIPTMTWILGGVGVVGLAGFTYFSLDGLGKESDLDSCKPNCSHDDVQSAKTSYLIGDISLGVGVVALAGAAYFYFSSAPKTTEGPAAAGVRFDVRSGPSGTLGVVSGRF